MNARVVMKLNVEAVRATTPEVGVFTLRHPRRPALPTWEAGAQVDLHLPDGRVRQYSLCGDPADTSCYELAVKREAAGRGGSAWVHQALRPGAEVRVSAPRNNFPLVPGARRHLLVGGGIGVTPLAPMARTLAREGAAFTLHLLARSRALAPLLPELEAVCGTRLETRFSDEGRRFGAGDLGAYAEGTHLYACGPARLLDALREEAGGWPPGAVHTEVFQPLLDEGFVPEPFEAVIASTGAVLPVPAERSLLDVLREAGLPMPSSCELGVCAACTLDYAAGEVIHRDVVLPPAARATRMTPCVSRARGRLTLAL